EALRGDFGALDVMDVHLLLLDEVKQEVEGALVGWDRNFVGRCHFQLLLPDAISLRFLSQPKTASRTRVLVVFASTLAVIEPASMISRTRAGCFAYRRRRSRTGAIHWIR